MPNPPKARSHPESARRRKPSAAAPSAADAEAGTVAKGAAYAPAVKAGLHATTQRVQEMHQAVSGHTFDTLLRVPGLSVPTRIVQGVHDAIIHGVYAAVRQGTGAAFTLAGGAEQRLAGDADRTPGAKEQSLRSALNGVFGDALDAMSNPLAIRMGLHAHGEPLAMTPAVLGTLRPRVLVFVHGLSCDERSWAARPNVWANLPAAALPPHGELADYGSMLELELPASAVYLRYNTGLALDDNAQALAELLAGLQGLAPQVNDIVLIGHSMGGLVTRRALTLAADSGMAWPRLVATLICIGSPHQGAALERLGVLTSAALGLTKTTRPLARIADARSAGIKDLAHGLKRKKVHTAVPGRPLALKLVFGTLGDEADTVLGPLIGQWLGDGLVQTPSASDRGNEGDVERCELQGLGHMALLSHPRVYALLRRWLGVAGAQSSAGV